jgi:hypothetical protein
MKKFFLALSFFMVFALFNRINAQCDTIANICAKHIISTFISDGQHYRALLLNSEETAEFHTTFFGKTTYRIAACSGTSDGNLVFNIYDEQRHLLFTNLNQKNAPYWDFKLTSTLDCTIEAQLIDANAQSGCAVLLISFKQ